jgi:hypothetical protein
MRGYIVSYATITDSSPMANNPKYYTQRRQVFIPKATADAAQCLRPTSAFTKITTEALQEWIAEEQRRAELLARAEKKLT